MDGLGLGLWLWLADVEALGDGLGLRLGLRDGEGLPEGLPLGLRLGLTASTQAILVSIPSMGHRAGETNGSIVQQNAARTPS